MFVQIIIELEWKSLFSKKLKSFCIEKQRFAVTEILGWVSSTGGKEEGLCVKI